MQDGKSVPTPAPSSTVIHQSAFIDSKIISSNSFIMHLRTYTDGSSRPLASPSSWTVYFPPAFYIQKSQIQVGFLDDLLTVGFPTYNELNKILIWDWKSGTLLNRICIEGTCGFRFLTSACLLDFNCTDLGETDYSIGLFIYNDVQEKPVDAPDTTNDVYIAADYAVLSPAVELEISSRTACMRSIIPHSTRSQRNLATSGSSAFRISQDPSINPPHYVFH